MKLGQTEGVKKLRELRKDIARIKTIARERELRLQRRSAEGRVQRAAMKKKPRRRLAKP